MQTFPGVIVGILAIGAVLWLGQQLLNMPDSNGDGRVAEWVSLETGETFKKRKLPECNENNGNFFLVHEFEDENGETTPIASCSVFGTGRKLLYENGGRAQEIAQIVRDYRTQFGSRAGQVWPDDPWLFEGRIWDYRGPQNNRCLDIWAADLNRRPMGAATGFRYRYKKGGSWSDWFERPDVSRKSIVHWVSDVEVKTPDGFPRIVGKSAELVEFAARGQVARGYLLFCLSAQN